jgi:hypothetical protein
MSVMPEVVMHPAYGAVIAVVLFWGLLLALGTVLSDSIVDPAAALGASVFIGIIVFRALRKAGRVR